MDRNGIPSVLLRHLPFFRQIFEEGTVVESAIKRKPSDVIYEERVTPPRRDGQELRNENGDASSTLHNDASIGGQHQPLSVVIQAFGNFPNLPSTSVRSATASVQTDAYSATVRNTRATGEHRPLSLPIQATGNLNHPPSVSVGTASASVLPEEDTTTIQQASISGLPLSLLTRATGNPNHPPSVSVGAESDSQQPEEDTTIRPHASNIGEVPLSLLTRATGNLNHPPSVSVGTASASVLPEEDATTDQQASVNREEPPPLMIQEEFRCPICLDTYQRRRPKKRLRCSHEFHQSCIDIWINHHRSCPVCRAPQRRRPHFSRRTLRRNRRFA